MSDLLSAAENLPEKPFRSKLEKYATVIAVLRGKKRYSYQEIADFLHQNAGVEVDPSTVWDFVQAQAKRRRNDRKSTSSHAQAEPAVSPAPSLATIEPPSPKHRRTVYVPPTKPPTGFDPASLRTNDEVDDS